MESILGPVLHLAYSSDIPQLIEVIIVIYVNNMVLMSGDINLITALQESTASDV